MLSEVSREELQARIAEMRSRLTEFQQEYGVESPEALTTERTNELLDDEAPPGGTPDEDAIQEWQTTRRNLAFANAALSIATAEQFVEPGACTQNAAE